MTAALAVRTRPPLIRLRPAPDPEPPFEEEAGPPAAPPPPARPRWVEDQAWRRPAAPPTSEARLAAHRYLAICLEVVGGFRPATHLRVLTAVGAFERITGQLARLPRGARETGGRVVLRHLVLCEPIAGVAEVAAVVGRAGQVWAMALRLERHHGVWLCSHLEVV
jgi:Family of unknown function (DUF6459)